MRMQLCSSLDRSKYNRFGTVHHSDTGFVDPHRARARWLKLGRVVPDDSHITYTHNSQGYRCGEWSSYDWSRTVAWFGCSEVYGVGVPECDTVTSIYSERTGVAACNFGIPGGSCGEIAALVVNVLDQVDPLATVIGWPFYDRMYCCGHTMAPWNYADPDRFLGTREEYTYCRSRYKKFVAAGLKAFRCTQAEVHARCAPVEYHCGHAQDFALDLSQTWWEEHSVDDLAVDGFHSNGARNRRIVDHLLEYEQLDHSHKVHNSKPAA